MIRFLSVFLFSAYFLSLAHPALAQTSSPTATADGGEFAQPPSPAQIREMGADIRVDALRLFRDFLSRPNDAHFPDQIAALNAWMAPQFGRRGFSVQKIPTGGAPALFAERRTPGATKTALIYLQADGQPVDPNHWDQDDPYTATLKRPIDTASGADWATVNWADAGGAAALNPEWRIFARSAADSKGPMTQFWAALDAIDRSNRAIAYNLKVIVDTEEELGSPHLAPAINAHRDLLAADFLLIFDGPPHASNKPTVVFGARGITTATLSVYGPERPQHSGHYGNFVPNPALRLAQLLASMKSEDGRIQISGFYDGVSLDQATKDVLNAVPDDEAAILDSMGLIEADAVAPTLQEAIQHPSLNIRGMAAAWTGKAARTIIPSDATAEIDIRTVKETDPAHLIELMTQHIRDAGYRVLDRAPTAEERRKHPRIASLTHHIAYDAFRSPFDAIPGRIAQNALTRLYNQPPILIRSHGGSIPIAPLVDILELDAAIVPTVNIDNNQHSPNENIRVGNFFEGIDMLIAVLTTSA